MKNLIKLISITLLSLYLNPITTNAQCHIDDWTALKALYESTDGDNWTIRTGWDVMIDNQTSPPANCNLLNLYGVTLSGPRVSCLDLDGIDNCSQDDNFGNYLVGNLPPELNKLTFLNILRLSNNFLQGEIPPEIGNISFLTSLSLRNNFLSGSIPSELGNLNFLEELDLTRNQLTGNIPAELGNLTFLKNLYLEFNFLNGSLPPQLGNLTQLNGLLLAHNQLSGSLPIELSNLINLETLYLNVNQLSGNIPTWLCNLTNLKQVKLGNNQFTGELPNCLCNLTNLNRLEIDNNGLWGSYPSCYIQFCTQFTSPDFNCNADIGDGNNFNITWEDFCTDDGGKCDPNNNSCACTDPTACNYNANASCDDGSCNFGDTTCADPCSCNSTSVWPGDINVDGICNHIDIAHSHLFIGESGPSRDPGGIDWEPQACEDWGIPQANGQDIKHHDCDGNGHINTNDANAIIVNRNKTHHLPLGISTPSNPVFLNTDFQIDLQPINDITTSNTIVMDVVMESKTNTDLDIFAGYFTIDISDIAQNVDNSFISFESVSWLGIPNINLLAKSWYNAEEKIIEVGFTRTNGLISSGNGVIAKLFVDLGNTNLNRNSACEDLIEIRVKEIGSFNENKNLLEIEEECAIINIGSSCCQPFINITEKVPFQNLYKSSGAITTNNFLSVGQNQEVEYNANRVTLNTGFSVKAGADFKVRSSGCN